MDSHLFRKAAWRLPALADLAVLRFNTRGTTSAAGTSEGRFDAGNAEGLDLRSAVDFALDRGLPDVWVVGWSFGTDVVLRHGLLPGVRGAILLSPPLWFAEDTDLDRWAADGRPLVVMVPQHDDFLPRMRPRPTSRSSLRAIHPRRRCQTPVGGEKFTGIVLDQIVTSATDDHRTAAHMGRPDE